MSKAAKFKIHLYPKEQPLASQPTSQQISETTDPIAMEILQKVRQRYSDIKSYSDTGETTAIVEETSLSNKIAGQAWQFKGTSAIRLGKPDYYLIEYEQKISEYNTNRVKVWSEGKGDFIFMTGMDSAKLEKDRIGALSMAGPNSNNVASYIPKLFFNMTGSLLTQIQTAHFEKDEKCEDEDCYVITFKKPFGNTVTLWIAKETSLIRKIKNVSDPGYQSRSEEQESKKMEAMRKRAENLFKERKFTTITIHRNIKVDFPVITDFFHPKSK